MHPSSTYGELDDLFERLPAALYRTSVEGRILAANQATADLLGYTSVAELVALDLGAVHLHHDPDERAGWRRSIETAGVVRDFVIRLRRKDGTLLWARDTARAVYDEGGSVRFYEGVLTDITNEIWASISSSILSGIIESTDDFVIVFDAEGTLRFANRASRDFLGLTEEFVAGRPGFAQVLPSLDWEGFASRGLRGWSGEVSIVDPKGRPCPLWVVVTKHDSTENGTYVAAIARDLTQVKRTQRRLEELVTAKDVFVATVSHELRNPLTGVVGLAEELRDGFDEFGDEERRDLITLIAHQAGEMTSLVDDLLVAVRSDVGEVAVVPETLDVVDQLVELASVYAATPEWTVPPDETAALVDPHRFRQIVRNLLSNAVRHGGGDIRLSVERAGDEVAVTVSDNGRGVEPEDVERIFEPYQRADGVPVKHGSVGLGLSVARRLARLMGGDLAYAHVDGWTRFRLTVPAAEDVAIETG